MHWYVPDMFLTADIAGSSSLKIWLWVAVSLHPLVASWFDSQRGYPHTEARWLSVTLGRNLTSFKPSRKRMSFVSTHFHKKAYNKYRGLFISPSPTEDMETIGKVGLPRNIRELLTKDKEWK